VALTETVGSVETTGPSETWKRLRHRRKPVKGMRQQDFTTVTDGIPKGQVKWVGEAPMTNWVKVWSGIWKPKVPTRWNEVMWKTAHRVLWTGEKAARLHFGAIPEKCKECEVTETITHIFFDCPRASRLREEPELKARKWTSIKSILQDSSTEQRTYIWTVWTSRCESVFDGQLLCYKRLLSEYSEN